MCGGPNGSQHTCSYIYPHFRSFLCSQRSEEELTQLREEVDVLQSQASAVRKLEDTVKRYKESLEGMDALKIKNKVSRHIALVLSMHCIWPWAEYYTDFDFCDSSVQETGLALPQA